MAGPAPPPQEPVKVMFTSFFFCLSALLVNVAALSFLPKH